MPLTSRAAFVVTLALLWPGAAMGQAPETPRHSVALTWLAPPECPTLPELRAAIAHALEWNAFPPRVAPDLVLAGAAHAAGERWAVSLQLTSPDGDGLGRRELVSETASCADALDAVALVAAMMIESPRREARLTLPTPHAPRDGWRVTGAAGATVDFFTGPSPAFGARAEVEVGPPHVWPFRLAAAFFPETTGTRGSVSAQFRLLSVGLATCPTVVTSTGAHVDVCAGVDVVMIEVAGAGLEPAHPSLDVLPRPFAGFRGDVTLAAPLHVGAGVEVGVPLVRYRYEFMLGSERVTLHEIPPVTLTAWVTLSLSLP